LAGEREGGLASCGHPSTHDPCAWR
jgi:hypothetical protein